MRLQKNYITGIAYEGRNQASLMGEKAKNNYKSDSWMTYLQAKEFGLKVKRGEHRTHIVRFLSTEKVVDGKKTTEGGRKFYTVFNEDQTEPSEVKNQAGQDEIQENTGSMEEKLEELEAL
jgi:antirestriction protein ArdC